MSKRALGVSLVACALMSWAGCGGQSATSDSTRLTGAGSTFAYPLYSKWADAFGMVRPDVAIDYQSIGSGGGIGGCRGGVTSSASEWSGAYCMPGSSMIGGGSTISISIQE